MLDSELDAPTVASQDTLSNADASAIKDASAHIDQQALKQAQETDSRNRERHKENTKRRFNGAVVEARKGLFLYRISDDPLTGKGDRFDRKEIARLQALISVTNFLDEMLAAYHPERNNDDNHWHNLRALQGWLSGRRYYRKLRRGGFRSLYKPASAYCARLAIAARLELLRPLEISPIGGGKRKRKKGLRCERCKKRLALLCRKCSKTNAAPRKPVQSEKVPQQQIEEQQ